MEKSVVSLIIPVYKNAEWVKNAVSSALRQSYETLEILLVDDGSPDGCGALCDEFAKADERVKVFHKENGGVSSARNVGLDHASGKYIAFLDSDDFLEQDHIFSLVSLLEESGSDIASCGLIFYRGEDSFDPYENVNEIYDMSPFEAISLMHREDLRFNGYLMNKLFRREVLEGVRFDPAIAIHEDMLFLWDALQNCRKVSFVPKFTYHYLYHEGSAINGTYTPRIESAVVAAEMMLDKMKTHYPVGIPLAEKTLLFACLNVANRRYFARCLDCESFQKIRAKMKEHHSPEAFSYVKGLDNRISYRAILMGKGFFVLWRRLCSFLRKVL